MTIFNEIQKCQVDELFDCENDWIVYLCAFTSYAFPIKFSVTVNNHRENLIKIAAYAVTALAICNGLNILQTLVAVKKESLLTDSIELERATILRLARSNETFYDIMIKIAAFAVAAADKKVQLKGQ